MNDEIFGSQEFNKSLDSNISDQKTQERSPRRSIVKINVAAKEKLLIKQDVNPNPFAIIKATEMVRKNNRAITIMSATKEKLMKKISLNFNAEENDSTNQQLKVRSISLIPIRTITQESEYGDDTPSPSKNEKNWAKSQNPMIIRSSDFYGKLNRYYTNTESSPVSIENTPITVVSTMTWQNTQEKFKSGNDPKISYSHPKDIKPHRHHSNVFINVKAKSISPTNKQKGQSVRNLLISIRNRSPSSSTLGRSQTN
ncbi:unnamed protein product [Blepharisma stoltei]|uniref:Uncharacterized protein n=1 Tax=Blepharisma stoltei TaxID=1481888 RepID=A0AAU9JE02_9CILI|nr:unnamed protein product [Blepharisma stoltei]